MQSVKFYEFGSNSYWINVVFNKQWEKYYLDISRKYTLTKDRKSKEGSTSTYLNLSAAAALVDQLPGAYRIAKNLHGKQSVEIYRLTCHISKTLYTFSHRPTTSNRERLGWWSARGNCRCRRHRSPQYRKLFCWTDADSLELEQICKDLGISEAETDPFMSSNAPLSQF